MNWLTEMGAFTDGLSMIQKVSYVIALAGASIGFVGGLVILLIRAKAAIVEVTTALRVKKFHDRARLAGMSPDFTKEDLRDALRDYVVPDCAQTDPSNSSDLRKVAAVRQSVMEAVDVFIEKSENKHLLMLADTGMGKTTFCLNYLDRKLKMSDKNGGAECAVIPLGRPNAIEKIKAITSKNDTILILDAFDEDVEAMEDVPSRLSLLMNEAASFKHVIVTCRSQFFRDDQSIPHRTGVKIVRPRKGGVIGEHVFETLYLLPFDEDQVARYVRKQFPLSKIGSVSKRKRAYEIINDIPELSVRPMLLALLPDLVKGKHNVTQLFDLYDFMISTWVSRESSWIAPHYLIEVSKALAVYIYTSRKNRQSERVSLAELHEIAKEVGAPEDVWGHLSARSLLNRDSEGGIKFSHRSIMEFFFVVAAVDGDDRCLTVFWTDFMRDLFVSWGNTKAGAAGVPRAKQILALDLEAIGLSPLSQPLSLVANYNAREYTQFNHVAARRISKTWREYSTKLVHTSGQRVLQDHEYGLIWVVPPEGDYGDPGVRAMTHIQITKGPVSGGLASRDQFLSLLEAESIADADLIPRDTYLWLGDTVGGQPVVVSISPQPFEKPGTKLIGSFQAKDRNGLGVWAYVVATRPAKFGERVPPVKAIPTMVSEIDWETGKRLHSMTESELVVYIEEVFNKRSVALL